MKKLGVFIAIVAGLLGVLLAQQPSHAQYDDSEVGVSEATLQKCKDLDIPTTECSEAMVLLRERMELIGDRGGSGTPMLATETGQMILFIGLLGAIFGSVAAGFILMGKRPKKVTSV